MAAANRSPGVEDDDDEDDAPFQPQEAKVSLDRNSSDSGAADSATTTAPRKKPPSRDDTWTYLQTLQAAPRPPAPRPHRGRTYPHARALAPSPPPYRSLPPPTLPLPSPPPIPPLSPPARSPTLLSQKHDWPAKIEAATALKQLAFDADASYKDGLIRGGVLRLLMTMLKGT